MPAHHGTAGKTPDQIKEVFGITDDFTQEEIDQVRRPPFCWNVSSLRTAY